MINNETVQMISEYINFNQDPMTLPTWCDILTKKKDLVKRLVVLTQFSIYVFKPNKDRISIEDKAHFYDISSIKIVDGGYRFKFMSGSFNFQGDSAKILADLASTQLYSIFLEGEMPSLSQELKKDSSAFRPVPTAFNRFCARLLSKNRFPPQSIMGKVTDLLRNMPPNFDLSSFPGLSDYIDGILFALGVNNNVTHLSIPKSDKEGFWDYLSHFIKYDECVIWLTVHNPVLPIEDFNTFCDVVKQSKNVSLQVIEFKDIIIGDKALESIKQLHITKQFQSIQFSHCSFNIAEKNLLSYVDNYNKHLKYSGIGFNTMYFIKRNELISSIFGFRAISLRGIGIELSKLFEFLHKSRVSYCDFSSNPCNEPISVNLRFPSTLSRLYLDNINWCSQNLGAVFMISSCSNPKISLSIARISMDNKDWPVFDTIIGGFGPPNIEAINWAGNNITAYFSRYLLRNENLEYICLSGCNLSSEHIMNYFRVSNITYLDIHGTTDKKLGNLALQILDCIKDNKTIAWLDISHNSIGEQNSRAFYEKLFLCTNLRNVQFDNNGFTNFSSFKFFYENITIKNKNLYVYFPKMDVSKMIEKGVAFKSQIEQITKNVKSPKPPQRVSASFEEWMMNINGFFHEDNMYDDPEEVQMLDAPLSDYVPDEEEEENDVIQDVFNIWTPQLMQLPLLDIEKELQNISEKISIKALGDSLHYI